MEQSGAAENNPTQGAGGAGAMRNAGAGMTTTGGATTLAQVNLKPKKRGRGKIWAMAGIAVGVVIVATAATLVAIRPWETSVSDEITMTDMEALLKEYLAEIETEIAEVEAEIRAEMNGLTEEADDEIVLDLNDIDTSTGMTYRETILDAAFGIYQEYLDKTENDEIKLGLLEARLNYILSNDVNGTFGCKCLNDAMNIDAIAETTESARQVISVAETYDYDETVEEYTTILYERQLENGDDVEAETMG